MRLYERVFVRACLRACLRAYEKANMRKQKMNVRVVLLLYSMFQKSYLIINVINLIHFSPPQHCNIAAFVICLLPSSKILLAKLLSI